MNKIKQIKNRIFLILVAILMLGLLIEKFSEIIPTKFWYLWMAAAMAWLFDYNMSCFKKGITLIPGSGTVCKYENPLLFWSVSVFWTLVYGVSFLYLIYLLLFT